MILSDLFDPGWHLTIDGTPAPIWRTNRMMRGAFVPAGSHTLVYTYRSDAFRVGAVVSMAGLIVLGGLVFRAAVTDGRTRGRTSEAGDAEMVGRSMARGGVRGRPGLASSPWFALAALVVACYGGVLFGGQQFAFRDSAHFYYPLYWRVQQEWSAGRLPLWEPGANGGTPMLGTPMAAVLYPGKLVFALVPYAWGVRLYTVGHEVLAFWAMLALMRPGA